MQIDWVDFWNWRRALIQADVSARRAQLQARIDWLTNLLNSIHTKPPVGS